LELENAVAIVTGGSEGIGLAIARALAAEGARVTITGRTAAKLKPVAEEIGADWIAADVGDPDGVARTFGQVLAKHGRLDILVNNAGIGLFKSLVDTTFEELERVYRTNVFGPFLMSREAAKHWIARGEGGELVCIASTSALKGSASRTAYGSSKFALRGMTECWRDELRRYDVRVTLVNPSEVMTEFAAKAGSPRERADNKLRPEDIARAIIGVLKLDHRAFVPELSVFATNPF
jgi:3-oxoacyl-[acyl-carrier protein] reductase